MNLFSLFKKKEEKQFNEYSKLYTEPFGEITNDGFGNMILSQNVFLSMNDRQTRRNNNVFVVGGAGSGKGRYFLKPNLLQGNCNYIVNDPYGDLYNSTKDFFIKEGYEIKVLNLKDLFKEGNDTEKYNPFAYIRNDEDIDKFVNYLIQSTNENRNGGDPFWEKSEFALLKALTIYIVKYKPKEQQNFTTLVELLRLAEYDDENPKSKLDEIFEEIEKEDKNAELVKQYKIFKLGAGTSRKGILISTSIRLTVFNMPQIQNLTNEDTLDLYSMGEGKKILFVVLSGADTTFNFIANMLYSQLIDTLYSVAEINGEIKPFERPVRFMFDEFTNLNYMCDFVKKLATMRKYNISSTIILQTTGNLKTVYKDEWESIIGCCDSFVFLGGSDYHTLECISKLIGNKDIVALNKKNIRKPRKNKNVRIDYFGDDIYRMPCNECVVIIRGVKPFYDKKFELTNHKNYQWLIDKND